MARGFERPPRWAVIVMVVGAALIAGLLILQPHRAPSRGFTASAAAPTSTAPARPVAVFLGDSFTLGTGSRSGDGFVQRTAQAMGWQPITLGVGGTGFTSPQYPFAERLPDVVKAAPRFVIVQGGTNDGGPDTQAKAAALFAALHRQLPHAVVVAVGPTQPVNPLYSQARMDAARRQIAAAAKTAGIPFLDPIGEGWLTSPGQLADQVHPTDAGYKVYADRLVADLRKVLAGP